MNPWALLAAFATAVGMFLAGVWYEAGVKDDEWTAKIQTDVVAATNLAIEAERKQNQEVNNALREQAKDSRSIANKYARELERLRQRPDRTGNVQAGRRAACKGATGAELSGPDARFLTREAARADELRAGLKACYAAIDAGSDNHAK